MDFLILYPSRIAIHKARHVECGPEQFRQGSLREALGVPLRAQLVLPRWRLKAQGLLLRQVLSDHRRWFPRMLVRAIRSLTRHPL